MSYSTDISCRGPANNNAASRGGTIKQSCSWVVPLRTSGARPPLFCASALGGDTFDYCDLAAALSEDQPAYCFGVPNLNEAEDFPTVERIAEAYVLKVRELQKRGPYYLCGHSFGGLVVYEMAKVLAGEGDDVGLVALLDAEHPAYSRNLPIEQRAKYYLIYVFDRLAKYGSNLSRGRIDRMFVDAFHYCYGWAKKLAWRAAPALFGAMGHEVPSQIRTNHLVLTKALRTYSPGEYRGRVDLFVAAGRPPEYRVDNTLGWRTCATGVLATHVVPGDHATLLHPPFVSVLAERMTPLLGRAGEQFDQQLPGGIQR